MFVDAREIPSATSVEFEVCVVGSGAAGIALAREFAGDGYRVCLFEGGGFEFDEDTQELYSGKSSGLSIRLESERQRSFGGTTNLWGGYCRPYDEEDFEEFSYVPHSGWPFRRSELEPYYQRAHKLCRLGPFDYDISTLSAQLKCPIPFNNDRLKTKFFRLVPSEPVDWRRFGSAHRGEVEKARNIKTFLFSNVTRLDLSNNGRSVTSVQVSTLAGNKFSVSAKIFVLATGGIENARLLLLPNNIDTRGTGNQHDLVGRYFMAHLQIMAADFFPSPSCPMQLFQNKCDRSLTGWAGQFVPILYLDPKFRRSERLLNFTQELSQITDKDVAEDSVLAQLRQLLWGPANEGTATPVFRLESAFEVAPNPRSRVTLSGQRDRFNNPLADVDWQLTSLDRDSLRRTYEILAREVGRAGLGRLKLKSVDEIIDRGDYWSQHHHMGTTRMHDDPKKGVVDQNCKVHGVDNLFLAGSSVFPTSGSATPTLTIVALAMRLADLVKDRLR
ncbi:MAG: GMC family oxidoreductase [Pseudomonadota bacterium]